MGDQTPNELRSNTLDEAEFLSVLVESPAPQRWLPPHPSDRLEFSSSVGNRNLNGTSTHLTIRTEIAHRFKSAELAAISNDLALAMHPWIDGVINTEYLKAIAAEIDPSLDIRSPSVAAVFADRLFRMADALTWPGQDGSAANFYFTAAGRLADTLPPRPTRSSVLRVAIDAQLQEEREFGPSVRPPTANNIAVTRGFVATACRVGSVYLADLLGDDYGRASFGYSLDSVACGSTLTDFDIWISELDHRDDAILRQRILATQESEYTLQEIADTVDLTRERVRQLEVNLRRRIEDVFGDTLRTAASLLDPMRCMMIRSDLASDIAAELTRSCHNRTLVTHALLVFSLRWEILGRWIASPQTAQNVSDIRELMQAEADGNGLIRAATNVDSLMVYFRQEEELESFLIEICGFRKVFGIWSIRDSQRSRIAAALWSIGRPATKTEISALVGIAEEGRISSTLSTLDGVVRADKERWGMAEWIDDPYEGIVAEIAQRIDANHGSVAVASLLEELPRLFGVSESSINIYLQTDAFIVESGFASRTDGTEFTAQHPSRWTDAQRLDGHWAQIVQIEQRHFDGYSIKVRFDIAYANGIRPKDRLHVNMRGTSGLVSIIWRDHDPTRAIDVGRVAVPLTALRIAPGDRVLVCPMPSEVAISRLTAALGLVLDSSDEVRSSDQASDPLLDLLAER